jgi:hypothetical protein
MTALSDRADLGSRFQHRERHRFVPSLALRRRSADHPIVMFSLAVSAAFLSMAFVPSAGGPAFASFAAPAKAEEGVRTTAKTSRLRFREADPACFGLPSGMVDLECLVRVVRSEQLEPQWAAAATSTGIAQIL